MRHAESEWNAQSLWQGRGDPPLSDRGRILAARAADSLPDVGELVFASPLRRAVSTAQIIAAVRGLGPVEIDDDLQEWDVGEWTGLTSAQIEQRFPNEFAAWREGTLKRYPGGGDRTTHHGTVLAALRRIVAPRPEGKVLVVTHAGSIGSLEHHLGVHPGRAIRQLEGRWFELGDTLRVASERVALLDDDLSG